MGCKFMQRLNLKGKDLKIIINKYEKNFKHALRLYGKYNTLSKVMLKNVMNGNFKMMNSNHIGKNSDQLWHKASFLSKNYLKLF